MGSAAGTTDDQTTFARLAQLGRFGPVSIRAAVVRPRVGGYENAKERDVVGGSGSAGGAVSLCGGHEARSADRGHGWAGRAAGSVSPVHRPGPCPRTPPPHPSL